MSGKNPKRPRDANQLAKKIVDLAAGSDEDEEIDPASAKGRGAKGGANGGSARANALSPEERRAIARKAAQARWKNSVSED